MEFLTVESVETAREKLLSHTKDWLVKKETVSLRIALGRILAEDVTAPEDIPAFRRSTVDGYAVISSDTAAAGENIPVFFTVKDKIKIGQFVSSTINHGECADIPTGGMLPSGADAVVMAEYSELFGVDGVAIHNSAANGENTVQIGEDAKAGDLLIKKGKRLLPQDIGALAAAGITAVSVFAALRIAVISTGDELVSTEKTPSIGQVRDINTHALTALAEKTGFFVTETHVLTDDENILEQTLLSAMKTSDIVAVSGGSSQGAKDMTKSVIDRVASPGVFTHGLAVKPGKPTILGYDKFSKTLLAGLPGHPVSAMIVFELMFGWLMREITGTLKAHAIPAQLSVNVASSPGKLTCFPVKLKWTGDQYSAEPVFGKSGLITTLTNADGYFTVDRETEGLQSGRTVLVHLF
ncbi:MAG: molybdopterin-binding protein [Oscillospiraceae bacterium]|nr:molybdopterin-binding protein [Oscillospiraceae bacterium]